MSAVHFPLNDDRVIYAAICPRQSIDKKVGYLFTGVRHGRTGDRVHVVGHGHPLKRGHVHIRMGELVRISHNGFNHQRQRVCG